MGLKSKYRFSFTAASLMLGELINYARILTENDFSIESLVPDSLKKEKAKTGKREFAELKLRLATLSDEETQLLADSDLSTQKLIAYLACCRAYCYIRDFVSEVILEKVSIFDHQITDRDYNAFFSKKCVDHDELEILADTTKAKIKQVVFKVLEQAGLIDNVKARNIIRPIVDARLENILKTHKPSDLALLLIPQYA
jgi:hypothetical protein